MNSNHLKLNLEKTRVYLPWKSSRASQNPHNRVCFQNTSNRLQEFSELPNFWANRESTKCGMFYWWIDLSNDLGGTTTYVRHSKLRTLLCFQTNWQPWRCIRLYPPFYTGQFSVRIRCPNILAYISDLGSTCFLWNTCKKESHIESQTLSKPLVIVRVSKYLSKEQSFTPTPTDLSILTPAFSIISCRMQPKWILIIKAAD